MNDSPPKKLYGVKKDDPLRHFFMRWHLILVDLYWRGLAVIFHRTSGYCGKYRPPKLYHEKDFFGVAGERQAIGFLKKQSYRILHRNLDIIHCEIDIIAVDRTTDEVVFVEVKTRKSVHPDHPVVAIGSKRREKLRQAAKLFLRWQFLRSKHRFDVVGVIWPDEGEPTFEHYKNAFHAKTLSNRKSWK